MALNAGFLAGATIALVSCADAAHAGAILASVTVTAPERGSVSIYSPGGLDFPKTGDMPILVDKTFDGVGYSIFTFPVEHGGGDGGTTTFTFLETIGNETEAGFTDYRFAIIDAVPSRPVAFTDLDATFIKGFTLNLSSGPRELRLSGLLASGLVAEAAFHLTVPDPGEGNSYTFTLIQGPAVTISEPAAFGLAGVGLLSLSFLRRRAA
jgi:hypothetical protein